ncbi:Tetraspanin-6 [Habropoda laboriosa]|uniref:Tetraspanin n=1 Tax=Habropoda laboriosa TaxID=597456 RepID=A0A0L7QW36_9HYME|nr:PREDICTED: tetraspanin-6-like [Habropoda laboriosa]KOC62827.1 Tetraspanin-6 [Habropoda laboriosa]
MTKRLETVAMMACLKTLLMLFNCIFWIFGILMLCIGIWMQVQLRNYVDMNSEGSEAESRAALLAIASLGAIVTLTATLACCCTTRGHPALLYLYGAFLAVVALVELGVGASIYAYRTNLNEKFDTNLNDTMAVYGQDARKTSYIDTIQYTLQCCGNRCYTDWLNMYPPKAIPLSCCKVATETCDTNDTDDIYTQGCYTRMMDCIVGNIGLVAAIAIGVAFLPLVGVFLACCLASNINKVKYEQVA